jgi:hypothetical protein
MVSPATAGLASATAVTPASQKPVFIVRSLLNCDPVHRSNDLPGLKNFRAPVRAAFLVVKRFVREILRRRQA